MINEIEIGQSTASFAGTTIWISYPQPSCGITLFNSRLALEGACLSELLPARRLGVEISIYLNVQQRRLAGGQCPFQGLAVAGGCGISSRELFLFVLSGHSALCLPLKLA